MNTRKLEWAALADNSCGVGHVMRLYKCSILTVILLDQSIA